MFKDKVSLGIKYKNNWSNSFYQVSMWIAYKNKLKSTNGKNKLDVCFLNIKEMLTAAHEAVLKEHKWAK